MEWGARALGNRSILASGHDYRVVDQLNEAIKQRDLDTFAPSILKESNTLLTRSKGFKALLHDPHI